MSDDVELGLKFTRETATGIESISDRMRRLDADILQVQRHLDGTVKSLDKLGAAQKSLKSGNDAEAGSDPYKTLQTLLGKLRTEQAAAKRFLETEASRIIGPNATKNQKAQINAAINGILNNLVSSLTSAQEVIQADAQKRLRQQEAEQKRLETKRRQAAKRAEDEYYDSVRRKENKRLSRLLVSPNRDLDSISSGELRALLERSKVQVKQAQKQGSYGTAQEYRQLGSEIGQAITRQMQPEVSARRSTLNSFRSKDALQEFITWAKPTELKQYKDDAQKSSKDYSKRLDVNNAEKMAHIANELDAALRKLDPKINRLYRTAGELKADPAAIKKLHNKSVEELGELQSAMMREANKRFSSGDSATGQVLTNTANQLKDLVGDKKAPYLKTNNAQLQNLLSGKLSVTDFNNAGLTSLKTDARAESQRLAKIDRFDPVAEQLRKLTKTIQTQIDQNDRIARGATNKTTKGVSSELSQYEDSLIRAASQKRYDDSPFKKGGSFQGLNAATAAQQQDVLTMTKRLQKAQQLRYNKAQENKESKETVALEKKSLDLINNRLLKVKATVQETKRLRDAEERRKTIDVDDLEYSAKKDIAKSAARRQLDGGAEQFRNQGLLLRNYAVMGAGVGSAYAIGQFTVDLDKSLKQLQSILALTNNEMQELEGNLISVSEKTKFTAVEVTEAAVVLGQSGLSKDQIKDTVEGITLFATAIGTDLKTAVDLATSTLGVFRIDSSRMTEVVDKLTTSVNSSKLNLDKLTLGIQYAGNIAAQSNVSFEETVATLGAMANSGIKSGSTLGTGLRQILITLQNPSDKFRKKISSLGLTMEDLNLRTHGLVKVMSTLANKGFTVTDAMQVMEVRAASAFGAFANNLEVAESLSEKMEQGGAATKANAVQMEAFSNQLARFGSIAKSVFYDALKPYLTFLTDALKSGGDFLQNLRGTGDALSFILASLTGIAALKVSASVTKLLVSLGSGGVSSLLASAGGGALASGAGKTASKAGLGALLARAGTGFLGGPVVGGLSLATTAGVYAYSSMKESRKYSDPLDIATASVNKNEASLEKYNAWLKTLDSSINSLYLKQVEFKNGEGGPEQLSKFIRKLNNELKDMGFYLDENASSFSDVSAKLLELQKRVTDFRAQGLTNSGQLASVQLEAQANVLRGELEEQRQLQRVKDSQLLTLDSTGYSTNTASSVLAQALSPELAKFNPQQITQQLSQLQAEDGVTKEALQLRSQTQEYYNLLSGVGNLPSDQIQALLTQKDNQGRNLYRFTETDPKLIEKQFRQGIQDMLDGFEPVKNTASTLVELARLFEETSGGGPQKELKIIDEVNREFKPLILDLTSKLGEDKQRVTKENANDPLERYNQAKLLADNARITLEGTKDKDGKVLTEGLEDAVKNYAIKLLTESFGEDYPKSALNRILTKSSVVSSTMAYRSEFSAFEGLQRQGAEKAYFERSEARLRTLGSEEELINAKIAGAKTTTELTDLEAKLLKVQDEVAEINKQRQFFKLAPSDTASRDNIENESYFERVAREQQNAETVERKRVQIITKAELEERKVTRALIKSEVAKLTSERQLVNAKLQNPEDKDDVVTLGNQLATINNALVSLKQLSSTLSLSSNSPEKLGLIQENYNKAKENNFSKVGITTLDKLDGLDAEQQRKLLGNVRYQRIQARTIKEFYENELKQQEIIITNKKTAAEKQKTLAQTLEEQAKAELELASDGQLGVDIRSNKYSSSRYLSQRSTSVENSGIQLVIEQYRQTNQALTEAIKDLQTDLTAKGISGEVEKVTKALITKYQDKVADNNLAVEKLTGEQKENTDQLVKQNQSLDKNTKALERDGYRFKTPENERLGARLRGGQYTSDSGFTEDFSANGESVDSYFEVVGEETNKFYSGFDALTESAKGVIDIAGSIGDAGASAFSSWTTGAQSAGDAFKTFGIGLLDQLNQIAMQILANQIMSQILGAFMGSAGGMAANAGAAGGGVISANSGAQISMYAGGLVTRGYASGGEITSGMESRDSTLIKAAKGEFVLRNEAVKAIGIDTVRQLNSLDRSSAKRVMTNVSEVSPSVNNEVEKSGGTGDINVWLVDDRSQVPTLGAQDVITIIQDDAARGGQTKKLIKSITKGDL